MKLLTFFAERLCCDVRTWRPLGVKAEVAHVIQAISVVALVMWSVI